MRVNQDVLLKKILIILIKYLNTLKFPQQNFLFSFCFKSILFAEIIILIGLSLLLFAYI